MWKYFGITLQPNTMKNVYKKMLILLISNIIKNVYFINNLSTFYCSLDMLPPSRI